MRAQDFDVAIRDFASSQIYWYYCICNAKHDEILT